MFPRAMLTGTLALTAFWLAFALERAACNVVAFCPESCAWPAPPQPITQLDPADCVWVFASLLFAPLPAPLTAPFAAVWFALDDPAVMFPPAMLTGTLALTAFWLAFALDAAS